MSQCFLYGTALSWLVIIGGLAPAVTFFVLHRPTRPRRTQPKLVTALVAVPTGLYLRSAIVLALHGGVPKLTGPADSIFSIGMGLPCDWFFIVLLLQLRRYRAAWAEEEMQP